MAFLCIDLHCINLTKEDHYMKRIILLITVIVVFTISSFSSALADPGKNKDNPGQSKKQQVQIQKQLLITNSSSIEKSQNIEEKTSIKDNNKEKALKMNKKGEMPPVIKIGNLQIPTNAVIKGLKATLIWDKTNNTIIISKNGISIKFVGDSKAFVDGVQVSIASIKNGKGKLVPMEFIQKILNGKPVVFNTTGSGINTTEAAITTTEAGITTTEAGITTTESGISH